MDLTPKLPPELLPKAVWAGRVERALRVPYHMTQESFRFCVGVLGVDMIHDPKSANTHPVLRTFHLFAEREAQHTYQQYHKRLPVRRIDVGGDPRHADSRRHCCMLVDNGRDQCRLYRAGNYSELIRQGHVCTMGAENCPQGGYGTSIHSGYDITMETWTRIFRVKSLLLVDLWIWEPHGIFDGNADADTAYGVVSYITGTKAYFVPRDGSAGYEHDWETWRAYRRGGVTTTRWGSVAVQCEGRWGALARYTLYRITQPLTYIRFERQYDLDVIRVPVLGQPDRYIDVPASKWNALVSWGITRPDDKFSRAALGSYARALCQKLTIAGGIVISAPWDISVTNLAYVVASAYIFSNLLRYTQTQTIGAAIKRMKAEQGRSWWWAKILALYRLVVGNPDLVRNNYIQGDISRLEAVPYRPQILISHHGVAADLTMYYQACREDCAKLDADSQATTSDGTPPDFSTYRTDFLANLAHLCADLPGLAEKLQPLVEQDVWDEPTTDIKLITGPPGCGKSTGIDAGDKLIICNTKDLRDQWKERGFTAFTQHLGLAAAYSRRSSGNCYAEIVIDEAPQIHPYLIHMYACCTGKLTLLGDPNQVGYIDFHRTGIVYDPHVLERFPTVRLTKTHRCPQDITQMLSGVYPELSTTSTVKHSISIEHDHTGAPPGKSICFTQATKLALEQFYGVQASTVHESQGTTHREVTLHIMPEDVDMLRSSQNHCVVAISRHTHRLVVREYGVVSFSDLLQTLNAPLLEVPLLPSEPAIEQELVALPYQEESNCTDANTMEATADDLAIPLRPCVGIPRTFPVCDEPTQKTTLIPKLETQEFVTRFVQTTTVEDCVLQTSASDERANQQSMLARLCRPRVQFSRKQARATGRLLFETFRDQYLPEWRYDPDIFQKKLAEYLNAADERAKLSKILRMDDDIHIGIKTFCKQQLKVCDIDKAKAGQSILAADPTCNAVLAPYVRAAEEVLIAATRHTNTLVATRCNDQELSDFFERAVSDDLQAWCCDFTQFDATQNEATLHFELLLLKYLGMPPYVARFYQAFRRSAHTELPTSTVTAAARISGESNTLFGNTAVTMAVQALACRKFGVEPTVVSCKGDDSVIFTTSEIPTSEEAGDFIRKTVGMICKYEQPRVAEYLSFFVGPWGAVPDVIRVAKKVCQRAPNFNNLTQADALQAFRESVRRYCDLMVGNRENLARWCAAISYGKSYDETAIASAAIFSMAHDVRTNLCRHVIRFDQ